MFYHANLFCLNNINAAALFSDTITLLNPISFFSKVINVAAWSPPKDFPYRWGLYICFLKISCSSLTHCSCMVATDHAGSCMVATDHAGSCILKNNAATWLSSLVEILVETSRGAKGISLPRLSRLSFAFLSYSKYTIYIYSCGTMEQSILI